MMRLEMDLSVPHINGTDAALSISKAMAESHLMDAFGMRGIVVHRLNIEEDS